MRVPSAILGLGLLGLASSGHLWNQDNNSCVGRCDGAFDSSMPCQCNDACSNHNDCCSDYADECSAGQDSCQNKCGAGYDPALACQCNDQCSNYGNCCPDYADSCGSDGSVTEADTIALGETLFALERNNVGPLISLDTQCTSSVGSSNDCSPNNLFLAVDEAGVLSLPVYQKLLALYDNYDRNVRVAEDHTEQEHQEELEFLQALLDTDIMMATFEFLTEKGAFTGTLEDFGTKLYELWFRMYERGGQLSSSGFEHVFLGEIDGSKVGGFHNWFHWFKEEQAGNINYIGFWREAAFGSNQGGGLEFTYTWSGVQKEYGSMFIGTSPELEMALYTACLLTFPDKVCHVKLGGADVYIQTWSQYDSFGTLMVGSSYPDFAK